MFWLTRLFYQDMIFIHSFQQNSFLKNEPHFKKKFCLIWESNQGPWDANASLLPTVLLYGTVGSKLALGSHGPWFDSQIKQNFFCQVDFFFKSKNLQINGKKQVNQLYNSFQLSGGILIIWKFNYTGILKKNIGIFFYKLYRTNDLKFLFITNSYSNELKLQKFYI